MPSFILVVAVLLPFLALTSQARYQPRLPPRWPLHSRATNCTVPDWTVNDLNVTFSGVDTVPGNASFTLTNSITNASDALTCQLPFNSWCSFNGTKTDQGIYITLQFFLESAILSINETMPCGVYENGTLSAEYAIGTSELRLDCPEEVEANMTCLGEPSIISGSLAPL